MRALDRLENAQSALSGVQDLLCGNTDLNCVNPDNLYTLLGLILAELRSAAEEFRR